MVLEGGGESERHLDETLEVFVDAVVFNNGILSASIIKYWRMEREKVPMGF